MGGNKDKNKDQGDSGTNEGASGEASQAPMCSMPTETSARKEKPGMLP